MKWLFITSLYLQLDPFDLQNNLRSLPIVTNMDPGSNKSFFSLFLHFNCTAAGFKAVKLTVKVSKTKSKLSLVFPLFFPLIIERPVGFFWHSRVRVVWSGPLKDWLFTNEPSVKPAADRNTGQFWCVSASSVLDYITEEWWTSWKRKKGILYFNTQKHLLCGHFLRRKTHLFIFW